MPSHFNFKRSVSFPLAISLFYGMAGGRQIRISSTATLVHICEKNAFRKSDVKISTKHKHFPIGVGWLVHTLSRVEERFQLP